MSNASVGLPPDVDTTTFDRDGFAIIPSALSSCHVEQLLAALTPDVEVEPRGGIRNLFDVPLVRDLARAPAVRGVAEAILGAECFAVRALLFDKTPVANWKVTWHQDLTIAVGEHRDVVGYGPWSIKSGVVHVQPPREILECMVAVRVHLDPCGLENGPVRVIPGSHRDGKLRANAVDAYRAQRAEVACLVPKGGLLAMRPLLLHASSRAALPEHRRVIHFEFATGSLDEGLVWRWQV